MSKEMKKNTCSSGKFKRLNYYEGMLLTEQDFKAEQNYFREKMKLHNRLHSYGVVWGLGLTKKCIREGSDSAEKIFIEPGFALDCAGNEIIICHPYRLPLEDKIDELLQGCNPITEKICLTVSINYCEGESEPQPQYSSACEEDELQVKMSRICEGFYVELLPDKEIHDNCKQVNDCDCETTYRQDCLGVKECCEIEKSLILGCICIVPEENKQDYDDNQNEGIDNIDLAIFSTETGNTRQDSELISYCKLQIFIDPCCNPPRVCRPCASPLEQWEYHKHNLLQQVCKSTGMIDLVCLIGKPSSEAKQFLDDSELDLDVSVISATSLSSDPNQLSILIKYASSCVYPGSEIVLITDEQESCILFAFSIPSPAYTIEEAADNEQ